MINKKINLPDLVRNSYHNLQRLAIYQVSHAISALIQLNNEFLADYNVIKIQNGI